jgi:hypothetical protein
VAIVQISRITQRKGLAVDLPQPLAGAELGWATDERKLYIGNGTLADGAPVIGNTEVLTEFSDVLAFATAYTYQGQSASYVVQTGLTPSTPVSQSLQSRLDSDAIITDFGATGNGSLDGSGTDVTANINNALYQLYCRQVNPQIRRTLYFPAGVYIISDTLEIPPYCDLQGDGPESTIFYFYVPTWTSTIAYASGVLVYDSASLTYYRSVAAVPAGQVVVANPTYWTATTLPEYIFRTADSLQQTGANIGTNGALPPGFFTMSGMKFMTNQTHDGCLIQAAQDCAFESVNIAGPKTTATLTTAADNTACVRFDTTAAIVCQDIVWNHGSFSGMVYGVKTAEQIESVTFSNGAFDTLFQGVYLGDAVAPAVGPTGFRAVQNIFDNIYGEGIVIENVGNNCSAYNSFYDVGNHFLGTANPATVVIDINGINNVSVGDMFERTTQYASALLPRIKLNNLNGIALGQNVSNIVFYQLNSAGATPFNFANQLSLGTYQRMAGITDTLTDNVAVARTLFTFNAIYIKAVKIDYTITRGTAIRTGTYIIVAGTDASGTNLQGSDSGVQNSAPGQTFSVAEAASVVSWQYITSSTGTNATISYSVTKLA